jgi:cell wall-associated NlpC family hydrolase
VSGILRRSGRPRRVAAAFLSLLAVAGSVLVTHRFAGAAPAQPVRDQAAQLLDTMTGLRFLEYVTHAPTEAQVAAALDAAESGHVGLDPQLSNIDVRVQWYRAAFADQRSKLAHLVAPLAAVDPDALEQVWAHASDQRLRVVWTALAQVGDPYQWAAEGPDQFDCSGLVRFAWGSQGVDLPHWSLGQANSGEPVDPAAIAPGDLVHSPGHIMIALGLGDAVVHATTDDTSTVEVSRWGSRADAFTDPLVPRSVKWRVTDPAAADPSLPVVAEVASVPPPAAAIDTAANP